MEICFWRRLDKSPMVSFVRGKLGGRGEGVDFGWEGWVPEYDRYVPDIRDRGDVTGKGRNDVMTVVDDARTLTL